MKKMAVLLLLAGIKLMSGSLGTITGKVVDKESNEPLGGANIFIEGTSLGAAADMNGNYTIKNIPPGLYHLRSMMMGYTPVKIENVQVVADSTVIQMFALEITAIESEVVACIADREPIQYDRTSCVAKLGSPEIENLPVQSVSSGLQLQAGVVRGTFHSEFGNVQSGIVRSGRNNECAYLVDGVNVNENYNVRIPSDDWNTEEYNQIVENEFLNALQNPLSTFSIDVDAGSYGNCRRYLNMDRLPPKDAIRIEEFVNYFNYNYPPPKDDNPFSVELEYADCPWNEAHRLVHIGLKGKMLSEEEQVPSNLVFLLDVSGSMQDYNKLPLVKKAFVMLVNQLRPQDIVSIVVYAGSAGLVLPPTYGSDKDQIKSAIDRLHAGGSTAGGEGIKLAYKIAKENLIENGNNRVILATDGDFNVGVSSTSDMVRMIEKKREDSIYLTTLGFGMGNYKDHRLEQLADKGNGNHAYIDNLLEAQKVFVHDLMGTLFTIAKDVKIQVEFNPRQIESYRLIGYENRLLKKEDFDDDTKDAGEIGAGHTVTALYEVVPAQKRTPFKYELKYQQTTIKEDDPAHDELLTVKLRYKRPKEKESIYFDTALTDEPIQIKKASDNLKWSAAVAEFAMILRDSKFKENASFNTVKELAKSGKGEDQYGYREEFLTLVNKAELLLQQ